MYAHLKMLWESVKKNGSDFLLALFMIVIIGGFGFAVLWLFSLNPIFSLTTLIVGWFVGAVVKDYFKTSKELKYAKRDLEEAKKSLFKAEDKYYEAYEQFEKTGEYEDEVMVRYWAEEVSTARSTYNYYLRKKNRIAGLSYGDR